MMIHMLVRDIECLNISNYKNNHILFKYYLFDIPDDPNYERRQTIRYKTEKYLIKAEKIYNMYLAPEVKDLKLECDNAVRKSVGLFIKLF